MCIIIDTNKIHDFLKDPPSDDTQPIHIWLAQKGGSFVYTTDGKYGEELKTVKYRLLEYVRKGQARVFTEKQTAPEKEHLENLGQHISNDIHILALAKASGARLLYTGDKDLMADFKKKAIIDPRGKIYSGSGHKNLLKKDLCKRSF
ncbi:hypothetical protein [Candidatus Spongiihabitans sp.]|uniref:PIN domain-containing protein n=1 Tax=Candidatus Spongiihabitans sp. TaxID=3101308 RepID=UPI003C7E53B7